MQRSTRSRFNFVIEKEIRAVIQNMGKIARIIVIIKSVAMSPEDVIKILKTPEDIQMIEDVIVKNPVIVKFRIVDVLQAEASDVLRIIRILTDSMETCRILRILTTVRIRIPRILNTVVNIKIHDKRDTESKEIRSNLTLSEMHAQAPARVIARIIVTFIMMMNSNSTSIRIEFRS